MIHRRCDSPLDLELAGREVHMIEPVMCLGRTFHFSGPCGGYDDAEHLAGAGSFCSTASETFDEGITTVVGSSF